MAKQLEKTKIKWHTGFCGAAELELIANKEELEFQTEYQLSKEPLRIDLVIVKKRKDVRIQNEIGHIFKKHNIIEYKSPEDGLNIDDYYKTAGYACFYKGMGHTVNEIPASEITVSLFRDRYPCELFKTLESEGQKIEEKYPGIYYMKGNGYFDTQIVVMSQLRQEWHSSMRVLTNRAQKEDIKSFLRQAMKLNQPGEKDNVNAVLEVSTVANKALYELIRRENGMCEALREIMHEDLEAANRQGIEQGEEKMLLKNIKNMMQNLKMTAEQAMDVLNIPKAEQGKYRSKI